MTYIEFDWIEKMEEKNMEDEKMEEKNMEDEKMEEKNMENEKMEEKNMEDEKMEEKNMEEKSMEENMDMVRRKGITQVGLRYAVFAVVVTAIEITVSALLGRFAPELVERENVLLSFLLIIFAVDMVGFPLVYLLNRKLPVGELGQGVLGAGKFILGIFCCAGICGVGILIGTFVHLVVSRLCGADPDANNAVAMLLLNSKPFMRILTVGILAPVFEELIFRKVLVDHLAKYGKGIAVVGSGLLFGLFHGNFSQFFFATGLGLFFAYIYVKTGKVRYTIAYHMIVNMTTSVVTLAVTKKFLAAVDVVGEAALLAGDTDAAVQVLPALLLYLGWLAILGICALVGVVILLVNRKKFRLQEEAGAPSFDEAWWMILGNPGMLAFIAVCVFLFVQTYLPV